MELEGFGLDEDTHNRLTEGHLTAQDTPLSHQNTKETTDSIDRHSELKASLFRKPRKMSSRLKHRCP